MRAGREEGPVPTQAVFRKALETLLLMAAVLSYWPRNSELVPNSPNVAGPPITLQQDRGAEKNSS
jgi:hypothetical protein